MNIEAILDYKLLSFPIAHLGVAVGIVLLSLILRKLLSQLILKPLRRHAKKTPSTNDDRLIDVIDEPLKVSIVLGGIYFALKWLPFEWIDKLLEIAVRSAFTFIIFWIMYRLVEAFSHFFGRFSTKFGKEIHSDIQNFIAKALRVFIVVLGIMAILQEWGINVSAFVASLGLGGLAFALAAKDTVANLFGSFVIFTDRPFKVGDWIETPSVEGNIEEIGIRSTKIRTFAQALVSVPNASMADTPITNWSRMGKRRIKTRIGLTYTTTLEQMQDILTDIRTMLQNHEGVHQESIVVNFDEFESSALSIYLCFFTNTIVTAEYLAIREDINFHIMRIVAAHKGSFAFPSQSLYIESLPK